MKKKNKAGSMVGVVREIFVGIAIAVSTSGIIWIATQTSTTVSQLLKLRNDVDLLYSEVSETKSIARDNDKKMNTIMQRIIENGRQAEQDAS